MNIVSEYYLLSSQSVRFTGETVKSIVRLGGGVHILSHILKKTDVCSVLVILIPYIFAFTLRCFIIGLLRTTTAGTFVSQTSDDSVLSIRGRDAVGH